MRDTQRLEAARAILEAVTPLKGDCGKICGGACCKPDADGHGGMLLFPGEAALYDAGLPWAQITDSGLSAADEPIQFFTCEGACPRAERPLACRIFPLTPVVLGSALAVEPDIRAWPVCPLMPHGTRGLSPAFVSGVQAAMALLWEDETYRPFFRLLTGQLEAFKTL